MRPSYETTADREREADIAATLADAWRCQLIPMPPKTPFDYAAARGGKVQALVEIKTRTNHANKYPTYMISAEKINECLTRSINWRVPFYLVVSFQDQIMFWSGKSMGFSLEIGGRQDRGDSQDIELVYQIPMTEFKKIR